MALCLMTSRAKDIRKVSQRNTEFPECWEIKHMRIQWLPGSLSPPPESLGTRLICLMQPSSSNCYEKLTCKIKLYLVCPKVQVYEQPEKIIQSVFTCNYYYNGPPLLKSAKASLNAYSNVCVGHLDYYWLLITIGPLSTFQYHTLNIETHVMGLGTIEAHNLILYQYII